MMISREGNVNLALFDTKSYLWKYRAGMEGDATLRFPWEHRVLDVIDSRRAGGGGEYGAASSGGWSPPFQCLGRDLTSSLGDQMT